MRVVVHVDGGARGNPGPAAAAAVVSTPEGEVLDEAGGARRVAHGAELEELDEPDRAVNATSDERGRLQLAG